MNDTGVDISQPQSDENPQAKIKSLKELLELVSGRPSQVDQTRGESGLADSFQFPFLAFVGQTEMKLALILSLINPAIGGVLLLGPRGTGKTTAARSLLDLLPGVMRSACYYGCMPEDIETGGIDAVCPDCARKYGEGQPLTLLDRVHFVELPLNSTLDDVVGSLDDRALASERLRLKRGILAQADKNVLYIDEINLIGDEIIDAILDASAQGKYTVRRGPVSATYWSRMILIASMNPEEGGLRPQIMDRFGFRIIVSGLKEPADRLEAYHRIQSYLANPRKLIQQYQDETFWLRDEIQAARDILPEVELGDDVAERGIRTIQNLKIDSLRTEVSLFEAARAHAAADGRKQVTFDDIDAVALLTLRLRRSGFMNDYLASQQTEEDEINKAIAC